jgi:hypothetical protein
MWKNEVIGMKHLAPSFGKKLVVDIEARDIQRYQKERMATGIAGRTCNIEVGVLRSVLKRYGAWARIQPRTEMLPENEDAGHALSTDEETALLAECGKSRSRLLLPFVTVAVESAARYGTIRRLRWKMWTFKIAVCNSEKTKPALAQGAQYPSQHAPCTHRAC